MRMEEIVNEIVETVMDNVSYEISSAFGYDRHDIQLFLEDYDRVIEKLKFILKKFAVAILLNAVDDKELTQTN